MPKLSFDSADAVPEGLKEHAAEVDGKFIVDVSPTARVNEFRETNIKVSRERDELKGLITKIQPVIGDDPDAFLAQYNELKAIDQKVKDGTLATSDKIAEAVEQRVADMKRTLEERNAQTALKEAAANKRADAAEAKFKQSLIDRAIIQAVTDPRSGASGTAIQDILQRAYKVFKAEDDGTVVAMDGSLKMYSAEDGSTPLSPLEWVTTKLKEQAPHLFKGSSGGGAGGGTQNGGGGSGGDERFFGKSEEEFRKMSPTQKLALANDAADKKAGRGKYDPKRRAA
jgi:hypothetical protein